MNDTILIDRGPAIEMFRRMLNDPKRKRILRLTGAEKMGKTHLLNEYRHIAEQEYFAQCSWVDLRGKLQDYSDLLYTLSHQIGVTYFPNYREVRDDFSNQAKVEVSNLKQVFSTLICRTEREEDARGHQRLRLTEAFLQDLKAMHPNLMILLFFDAFEQADEAIQTWLNEQLLLGLYELPRVCAVLAGRQLPEPLTTLKNMCCSYDLPPVELRHHQEYCTKIGIKVNNEIIKAFHDVFEGKPGLFAEYASKLRHGGRNGI